MTNKIVINNVVVNRYAKALFGLTSEGRNVDLILKELQLVSTVLESSAKARAIVDNQFVPMDVQEKFLAVLEENLDLTENSKDFFKLLIKNRRLYLYDLVVKSFVRLVRNCNNEAEAVIISVKALKDVQIKDISDILEKKYSKKIICSNKVDDNIIGGIMIKIGSHMIDCSVANKLKQFAAESEKALLTSIN